MENNLKEIFYELKDKMQIFQLLDDEELEKIISYFEVANYPSAATVFNEGEEGDSIGFVISGKLQVKKETEFKGKQIVLAILSKGSFAGELSMLDSQPRTASIIALEDSKLLIIQREALESFIQKYPASGIKILKGIIRTMAIRQRKTTERLIKFF